MKVAANQLAALLRHPMKYRAILLHGEDHGLLRERAGMIIASVTGSAPDPFRNVALAREEIGRLSDEIRSQPLGGGRKTIRVRDATDQACVILGNLHAVSPECLVILESSALTPRSKLRSWAEREPGCAAIACYAERHEAISAEVLRTLGGEGLAIDREVVDYLSAQLASDSAQRRAELDKLALFSFGEGRVTRLMAEQCCATQSEASLGAAASAALRGDCDECERLLDELASVDTTGPGLLAVLAVAVHRLLKVKSHMDGGVRLEVAMAMLRPPVYTSQLPAFQTELRRWSTTALLDVVSAIRQADIACKRARATDVAIASRLFTTIAAGAPLHH